MKSIEKIYSLYNIEIARIEAEKFVQEKRKGFRVLNTGAYTYSSLPESEFYLIDDGDKELSEVDPSWHFDNIRLFLNYFYKI